MTEARAPLGIRVSAVSSEMRGNGEFCGMTSSSVAIRPRGGQSRRSAGDDQRPIRTGKRGTKGFDGTLINFAVFFELGKIVNETQMYDAIRCGRAAAQTIEIFQRAAMDF